MEYVECIMPAISAIFSLYFYLVDTNRKYFKAFRDMDSYEEFAASQTALWTYAFLELSFLIGFRVLFDQAVSLTRGEGRSVNDVPFFKLLGFILQKNMLPTVAMLCCWTLYANGASIAHFGSDWDLNCPPPP